MSEQASRTHTRTKLITNENIRIKNTLFKLYSRKAIRIVDAEDGIPVMTATVNMPDENLEEGEIILKNYSENEGCLPFMITNGVVSEVQRWVGHGMAVVKLLIDIDDI